MAAMPIDLARFEGRWRFQRSICHDCGDLAEVIGAAVFTPDPLGLIYDETGEMRVNGAAPLTSTRRYLWRAGPEVFFEDGRPFHKLPAPGQSAEHLCPPDLYQVRYGFEEWPRWSSHWRVDGPRKGYEMTTLYRRA